MPRTLSGLQTGEFDEIDVLHTVHINGNSGGAGQVLTSDGVNSDWNDIPSILPTGLAGQVLTSNGSNDPSFNNIPSQLPTGLAGQVLTSNGSSDPSFNDMPSTNLPNLTIQRTAGDKTYNGTIAVDVPAPKHLTVAHNGTDLLTYDPSATDNQNVNIDCKTLTMNVGLNPAVTYNTTSDNIVNVPGILAGNNISILAPYANGQQVNVDIGASGLPTNGHDINMASGTSGQPGGDITNVRNILMDSYVGEIGSTTNPVNRIYATRIYVGQIGDSGTRNQAIYSNGVFASALYPEIIHPPV